MIRFLGLCVQNNLYLYLKKHVEGSRSDYQSVKAVKLLVTTINHAVHKGNQHTHEDSQRILAFLEALIKHGPHPDDRFGTSSSLWIEFIRVISVYWWERIENEGTRRMLLSAAEMLIQSGATYASEDDIKRGPREERNILLQVFTLDEYRELEAARSNRSKQSLQRNTSSG
jgi:hypothetical protein